MEQSTVKMEPMKKIALAVIQFRYYAKFHE